MIDHDHSLWFLVLVTMAEMQTMTRAQISIFRLAKIEDHQHFFKFRHRGHLLPFIYFLIFGYNSNSYYRMTNRSFNNGHRWSQKVQLLSLLARHVSNSYLVGPSATVIVVFFNHTCHVSMHKQFEDLEWQMFRLNFGHNRWPFTSDYQLLFYGHKYWPVTAIKQIVHENRM